VGRLGGAVRSKQAPLFPKTEDPRQISDLMVSKGAKKTYAYGDRLPLKIALFDTRWSATVARKLLAVVVFTPKFYGRW
jgi:hypothetical protein